MAQIMPAQEEAGPVVSFHLTGPDGLDKRYSRFDFVRALAEVCRLEREWVRNHPLIAFQGKLTLEVDPGEAVASLHVFADHTDIFYGAEGLVDAFARYRRYKRECGRARLYINVYENQQAYDDEAWIIEDCLLGAGDFPG